MNKSSFNINAKETFSEVNNGGVYPFVERHQKVTEKVSAKKVTEITYKK